MSNNTILATTPLTSTGYHLKATGTTIGNSLIWDNGTNVGIGNTNTSYTLDVSGSLRNTTSAYFATTSGSVGIGTTSPSYTLDVYAASGYAARLNGSSYGGLILANAGTANTYMVGESTLLSIEHIAAINLRTNNADRVRITSAGNVGIGTSSPSTTLDVNGATKITGGGNTLTLAKSGGYPAIAWQGSTYTNVIESGDNYMAFYQSGSERMRITSGGNVCINAPENVNVKIQCYSGGTTTSTYAMALYDSAAAGLFYVRSDGTISMPKYGNGTMTISGGAIVVTSDKNLKKEDGFIENALDKVLKLTPRYFYWKDDSGIEDTSRQLGFYAQEVNEALGEEVANTPKDENGKWGIYDRGIVAMLTKAIQEMNTKLDEQNQTIQNLQEQINILAK